MTRIINRHVEQSNMHIILKTPAVYICDIDTFDNPRSLNYPFKNGEDRGLYIVRSCRGLLCLSMHYYPCTIFLYNPPQNSPFLPLMSTFYYPKGHKYLGFGYDHLSEDYKCVRIDLRKLNDGISFKSQIMVYSLRDDTWKRGAYDVPCYLDSRLVDFGYCVSLDGILHWSAGDNRRNPFPVVAFNLSDETFSFVPLPNYNIEEIIYVRAYIGVLDACLCLILKYWHYSDVWIMKEYGVAKSWTRMCRVAKRHNYVDLRPISFSKSRKQLLVILTLLNVASLDLETLEITNVQPPGFGRLWDAYVCLENLLMLKEGEHVPMGKHQL